VNVRVTAHGGVTAQGCDDSGVCGLDRTLLFFINFNRSSIQKYQRKPLLPQRGCFDLVSIAHVGVIAKRCVLQREKELYKSAQGSPSPYMSGSSHPCALNIGCNHFKTDRGSAVMRTLTVLGVVCT